MTQIGPDLDVQPSHAAAWNHTKDGLTWEFTLKDGLKDQLDRPISAADWTECLEAYRTGKPASPLASAFPNWKSTEDHTGRVILRFSKPDPYLLSNLSLLRFFRNTKGDNCPATQDSVALVGSGDFRPEPVALQDFSPQTELLLLSRVPDRSSLRFLFVKDDNTRALLLARGSADAAINTFSTGKTQWIRNTLQADYHILERDGVNVSYLGFNVRHKPIDQASVRRAIGLSIARKEIVDFWLHRIGTVASSLVSPILPESIEGELKKQEEASAHADPDRMLDEAGFPCGKDGIRFRLLYLTTTIREGYEMALLIRDQLAKIGVEVRLRIVEPSVFYQALKGGDFDLYSSRWIGVHDASVIHTAYYSKSPRNRTGYSDPEVDQAILSALEDMNDESRKKKFAEIQLKMSAVSAYVPLWYWNNDVMVSNRLTGLEAHETSASGAYAPLGRLKWRTP